MQTGRQADRRRIHQVVLTYTVVAALWILLSDKALEWLFSSSAQLLLLSTLKGWMFIAVTALLLYLMLLREEPASIAAEGGIKWSARQWLLFAGIVAVVLMITGLGVVHTVSEERSKEVARIQAIADLKSRQISDWLQERQSDAELLQTSHAYAELYRRWQVAGDLQSRAQLLASLQQLCQIRGYSAVTLFDAAGQRLWSSAPVPSQAMPDLQRALQQASATRQVQRAGPYLNAVRAPSLDFLAPLPLTGGPAPVVVLQTASSDWLNQTLRSWPVPSRSGETLLFRREGAQVIFLNDVRHLKSAALKLRLPLADKELLAAQLLRGDVPQNVAVTGRDYRQVPVIGVIRAIPGTSWYLVAKMDQAELADGTASHVIWVGLAGVLTILVAGACLVVLRQRRQLMLAEQERQSQGLRLQSLQLLAAVADSSEDPIFAKDTHGCYMLFNRAACALLGKSQEQVLGRDDFSLFPADQAEMLQQQGRVVIADDCVHSWEETLTLPDGAIRVFLTTKGPLKGEDGRCIGIFGISRDITQRNHAEKALAQQAEELRLRNAELERINAAMVGRELEMVALKYQINQLFRQQGLEPPYLQADQAMQELDAQRGKEP